MTLHRLLYEWTFYVLTTIGTQRPGQTKELVWRLQLPEALRFSVSYLHSSAELHFSASTATHTIHPATNPQAKKNKKQKHTHTLNPSPLWAQTRTQIGLQSLGDGCQAAETLSELVACFVSSSALFLLERYVTAGRGGGGRRDQSLAVNTPCVHPTSIQPLLLPHLSVQLCVFITCANSRLCYRLFTPRPRCSVTTHPVLHVCPACVKGFRSVC